MKPNLLHAVLLYAAFVATAAAQSPQAQKARAEADAIEARAAGDGARARHAAAAAEMDAAMAARRGGKREPLSERDELALAALEGLMSTSDERALPILQRTLKGTHGDVVKARALFVLSQIGNDEAQRILLEYAGGVGGELQREAVRSIGIGGNAKALEALVPLAARDRGLRRQVLEAFLIAGRKDLVMKLVQSAKDENEAEDAIRMLSAMGAVEELQQLGSQGRYTNSLIDAYGIAGDLKSLLAIAEGGGNAEQRESAIRQIGVVGTPQAKQSLRTLYAKVREPGLRDAVLQGMLIGNDEEGVLALYRAATDMQDKRNLLRTLSMMGGDAAIEAIDAALDGKSP